MFTHTPIPNSCALCLQSTPDHICINCIGHLPRTGPSCTQCGLPLLNHALCADCLQTPKPFHSTLTLFEYSPPIDRLLHTFKNKSPIPLALCISNDLISVIKAHYTNTAYPQLLVPTPMHWLNKWRRGFNQAHYLAEHLSKITHIPIVDALQQQRRTQPQKTLSRKARLKNLQSAFHLRKNIEQKLSGKHVAVVDDVITTCATGISLTECLLAAGAKRVDIWAIARTPKSGSHNKHL